MLIKDIIRERQKKSSKFFSQKLFFALKGLTLLQTNQTKLDANLTDEKTEGSVSLIKQGIQKLESWPRRPRHLNSIL